jgi:pullulanase/glycogen debranching enzyme
VSFPPAPRAWNSSCLTTSMILGHPDVIVLDPLIHRTSHYWHIFVPGIKAGQLYGSRADGPNDPANGQRFDSLESPA